MKDIDVRLLNEQQKERLGEDLSILFSLWDYKQYFPKQNDRTDINNNEYNDRKLAMQDLLWGKYESISCIHSFLLLLLLYFFYFLLVFLLIC